MSAITIFCDLTQHAEKKIHVELKNEICIGHISVRWW